VRTCSVEGCDKPIRAKDLCHMHYERRRLHPDRVDSYYKSISFHGMSETKTYEVWERIINRCCNKNDRRYADYGKRGITVCKRWRSFLNFFEDMGEVPHGKSIDRINNDGNYEPGNCRWATPFEQANNTRTNVRLPFNNSTFTISQIAKQIGIAKCTLYCRLKRGWSQNRLFEPLHHSRRG
jgi:hypothetical protein